MTAKQVLDKYYPYPNDFHEDCDIYKAMQEFARIKCLEAIKNTCYNIVDIINEVSYYNDYLEHLGNIDSIISRIQNIRNQDVMPEL